jgi:hypothetical protein
MYKKWVIGIIVIAILAGVTLLGVTMLGSTKQTATTTISQKIAVPQTFAVAAAYDQSSLVFLSDEAIIHYDYTLGVRQALTPPYSAGSLANSDSLSVSADKEYILFHNGGISNNGILANQLKQEKLDSTLDYWWVYDITSKTLRHLPHGLLMAKFADGHIYASSVIGSTATLITYDLPTLQQSSVISIPPSSDFLAIAGSFLLQSTDNEVFLTEDGVVNKRLFTDTELVAVTANKHSVIAMTIHG